GRDRRRGLVPRLAGAGERQRHRIAGFFSSLGQRPRRYHADQHISPYQEISMTSRRLVLSQGAALIGAASTGLLLPQLARAQGSKVRVGLMLPFTGTYAPLGVAIENGFKLAIDEKGGKLGGRDIEY